MSVMEKKWGILLKEIESVQTSLLTTHMILMLYRVLPRLHMRDPVRSIFNL